jgi:hypothetical protein
MAAFSRIAFARVRRAHHHVDAFVETTAKAFSRKRNSVQLCNTACFNRLSARS